MHIRTHVQMQMKHEGKQESDEWGAERRPAVKDGLYQLVELRGYNRKRVLVKITDSEGWMTLMEDKASLLGRKSE